MVTVVAKENNLLYHKLCPVSPYIKESQKGKGLLLSFFEANSCIHESELGYISYKGEQTGRCLLHSKFYHSVEKAS